MPLTYLEGPLWVKVKTPPDGTIAHMLFWSRHSIPGLLQEAGRIALKHYEAPTKTIKGDLSIVTEADRAIEAMFSTHFDHPEQGHYLLGEETIESKSEAYLGSALNGTAWVVDPIDGTAPYAHHLPFWGISLGLMEKGRLLEGAIYLPLLGEMFLSEGPKVFWARGVDLDRTPLFEPLTPVRRPWSDSGLLSLTQGVTKGGSVAAPNPVMANCCAVVPLAYLLLGRYQAYLGTLKLWDFAGGLPLLLKSGFVGKLETGELLTDRVNPDHYLLEAGHPKRWRTKSRIAFAGDLESADRMHACCKS